MLTRDSFLKHSGKLAVESVRCPALGGQVYVKLFSAAERDAYELHNAELKKQGKRSVRAIMLTHAVCDEQRNRLFTDDDIPNLEAIDFRLIEPLVEAAFKLNVLNEADLAELEGNSAGPEAAVASSSN